MGVVRQGFGPRIAARLRARAALNEAERRRRAERVGTITVHMPVRDTRPLPRAGWGQ